MKFTLILTAAVLLTAACKNGNVSKTEREGQPTIYSVESEDKEMNAAIVKANSTLPIFKTALAAKNPNHDYFTMKVSFATPDNGKEHIWLTDILWQDNHFSGVVNNEPDLTTAVALGDTVEIDNNKISDWMYLDKGRLRGGYTVRLLRERMGEEERRQFDSGSGMVIEGE